MLMQVFKYLLAPLLEIFMKRIELLVVYKQRQNVVPFLLTVLWITLFSTLPPQLNYAVLQKLLAQVCE